MQDALVSVLIPAYNAANFIEETLQSIRGQTYRNLEIVVVDDGSTDETSRIVQSIARLDSRVRLINGRHQGLPATRNRAALFATGLYLAPCDSDDLWHPKKIELQVDAIERTMGAGVSYCWSVGINEASEVIFPQWARHVAEGDVLHAAMEDSLAGSGSVTLIKRSCFDAVGRFSEGLSQGDEWQLSIALAGITKFVLVNDYLVGYRLHSAGMSNDFSDVEKSLEKTTSWITASWPDTPERVMMRRAYVIYCYLAFLALRGRQYRKALVYRFKALNRRPTAIVSADTMGFILIVVAQLLGIRRYYYAFWKKPLRWEGAPSVVGASALKMRWNKRPS